LQELQGYLHLNTEAISQQASANLITLELFIPYLLASKIKLMVKHTVQVKLQIQQLNTSRNFHVELH
jgi:hypothetical protein